MRYLYISLLSLFTLSAYGQSSWGFTGTADNDIAGDGKWRKWTGQSNANSSLKTQSDATGSAYHPTGAGTNFGGAFWDSALTAPFEFGYVIKTVGSGNDATSGFYLVATTDTNLTTGTGYFGRHQVLAGGTSAYRLRRYANLVTSPAGTNLVNMSPTASAVNDTLLMRVYADGRKTYIRRSGSTVDSATSTDVTYNIHTATNVRVGLYGNVQTTEHRVDDFFIRSIGSGAGGGGTVDTVPPVVVNILSSNATPYTNREFYITASLTDNFGLAYVIADSSQNGSTWAKWDSVLINTGTQTASYSYTSPTLQRASADTIYFRVRVREDSSHAGYAHFDTSETINVKISTAPSVTNNTRRVFGWLTFSDTRWDPPYSGGTIPADSIPWEIMTHASLFAANGNNPPQSSYINQFPYFTARAHESGVFAGICVGGSGDAALVTLMGNPALWNSWINTYLSYIDASSMDFIDFDLESGGYTLSNVASFFSILKDSLNTRTSGNDPSRAPFIVLTVSAPRAESWQSLQTYCEFVNVMSYDYAQVGTWGRLVWDNAPKSRQFYDGTGSITDTYGSGVNAEAPTMQKMALRVAAAGWPKTKINIGMDVMPAYFASTNTTVGARGPLYIRQPEPITGLTANGGAPTFSSLWGTLSGVNADSFTFDQTAQAYWLHTGAAASGGAATTDRVYTLLAFPGKDSGVIATRKVIDSMGIGVCIWNLGLEAWTTSATVPTGGRGWFFNQLRTHFSGIIDTNVAVISPPVTFTPANNATGVSTAPTLDWENVSGASAYHAQVSTVVTFVSTVKDTNSLAISAVSVTGLSNSTIYYYRVRVKNSANVWGGWSNTITFTTLPAVPGTPTLTSPADAATGQAQTLTFFWSAASGSPTHYQFILDDDVGFSSPFVSDSTLTILQRQVAGLANNTLYYWKVRAKSYAGGWGAYATARTFTTSSAIPSVPTLLTPVNGATNQAVLPTFTWTRPAGADSFQFQIDSTADFTTPLKDTLTALASYANQTLVSGRTYYWRAYSNGSAGNSGYSNAFVLTVGVESQPPAPGQPGAFVVHFDRAQNKYVSSGGAGFEVRSMAPSGYLKPVDSNNVMWGPRGYVDINGTVTTYATGSSGGTMTAQQILDSLKTIILDSLDLRSPLIKTDLRFESGSDANDTTKRVTISPASVSSDVNQVLAPLSGNLPVSDGSDDVAFNSVVSTEPIGISSGGTGSDLSGRGGTSQVLLKAGSGDTVTVRQLTTADISGYVTPLTISDTVSTLATIYDVSLKLNSAAIDTSTVLFWSDTLSRIATNSDISTKADTSNVLYMYDTISTLATAYDLTQISSSGISPTTVYEEIEDWIHNSGTGKMGWTVGAGTGSTSPTQLTGTGIATADSNRMGLIQFNVGTSAAGHSTIYLNNNHYRFGGGEMILEASVKTAAVVGAGNDYRFRVGFTDAITNAFPTDGAYFEWSADSGSQGWKGVTANNATYSYTSYSSAVTASTWYRLRIVVNADGSSAVFSINGTTLGTLTTNIPKASGREFGITCAALNYGAPSGSPIPLLDYIYIKKTFNPSR